MPQWIARGLVMALLLIGLPLRAEEATITEEVKPLSGYGPGFYIRSADDDFKFTASGRLQFRHRYENLKGVPDVNTFELRRARITFVAKLFKDFKVMTFVQHRTARTSTTTVSTPGGGTTNVNNTTPYWFATVAYQPIPQFGIELGTVGMPMDRQGEGSSGTMAFTEPPITATKSDGLETRTIARQSLGLPVSLGARLTGDLGRFHYYLGVVNGEDEHSLNATKEFAFSGRVAFDILGDPGYSEFDLDYSETPKFQIGLGSGYEGTDATDAHINAVTINYAWTSSADAAFKWRGLTLITEWYMRKLKVLTGNFTLDDIGYYAQAGYFVLPKKLELAVRGAQIFREGPDNNAYEFGGGVNWYIHGNNVKLQTDFHRLLDFDDQEGQGHRPFNRVRTMLTINI